MPLHPRTRRPRGALDRVVAVVLAAALAVVALVAPAPAATAVGEQTVRNPLLPNGADPWLQFHDGSYYLATTTWNSQLVMRKSPTLGGLRTAAPVHVWSETAADSGFNFWAPEFHRLTGPNGTRWYLMYTSGTSANLDGQKLRVLESAGDDPMGPYTFRSTPMPSTWNIDGTYLTVGGQLYLLWSEWQGPDQSIWISRMSNPWTVTGARVLISRPTHSWETQGGRTNEAPEVIQRNGRTHVVFSASSCNTPDYKLGLLTLTGADPMSASAWTKRSTPVFQRANGVHGPGHNGFFRSPDGTQDWIVYHGNATTSQGCGDTRSTRAQPFTWAADGTPNLGAPVSTTTDLAVPSGEMGPITAAVEGAAWTLTNRSSGRCAGVAGGSADGATVAQQGCDPTAARWVLDPTADGFYRLVNRATGKVLDVADCGTADGTDVRQWAWLNTACQQWRIAPTTDGWSRLTNRATGKVLDLADCSAADGANVRTWTANGTACQEWRLAPAGSVAVVSSQSGKVLDVADCSTAAGASVRAWTWNGAACQRWTFTHTDNGYYRVQPTSAPGSCLAVASGSSADGAALQQGACSGAAGQWRVDPLPDGSVRLVARHSGKALDLASCGLATGNALVQWAWLDNICQRFTLRAV
ncbi:RICIN domain-containing protein [Cellulomonas sp. NPDC057328]|uniref:RICIN domain-containing protein n=1 Tax=Cellulomonas sp. NPDC057328 TaxID=3346101 RepID=UPI003641BFBA